MVMILQGVWIWHGFLFDLSKSVKLKICTLRITINHSHKWLGLKKPFPMGKLLGIFLWFFCGNLRFSWFNTRSNIIEIEANLLWLLFIFEWSVVILNVLSKYKFCIWQIFTSRTKTHVISKPFFDWNCKISWTSIS